MISVSRSEAVKIFQGIGIPTADGWNRKRMQSKLDEIHNIVVDDATKIGDEELDELLDRLIAARENGEDIELLSDKQAAERDGSKPAESSSEGEPEANSESEPEAAEEMPDGSMPDETVPVKPKPKPKPKPKSKKKKARKPAENQPAENESAESEPEEGELVMQAMGFSARARRSGKRGVVLLAGSQAAKKVARGAPKYVGKWRSKHESKLKEDGDCMVLTEDASFDALIAASGFVRGDRGSSKDWK